MLKSTKYASKGLAIAVAAALLLAGCGKSAETGSEPTETGKEPVAQESQTNQEENKSSAAGTAAGNQSGDDLALLLKTKYDAGTIDYSGDTIYIEREESIQIKLSYNPWDDVPMTLSDSFVIYQDVELKHPLDVATYDWDSESGMLTIEPPVYGPAEVVLMDIDHPANSFLEANDETGWGNLPQLYLAAYVDAETGEPLTGNPLVTVLKIKQKLDQAPQVKFSQDEYGSARFSWKAVPGAEEYFLFRIKNYEGALDGYLNVMGATAGTEWTVEQGMSEDDTYAVVINDIFRNYQFDDFQPDYVEYFGVMAVTEDGNSNISNLFNVNELGHMLPFAVAANEETGVSCKGTMNLPATMGVTMCDDTISQRVLAYDENSIEKSGDGYKINYKICGTPFNSTFLVAEQDWDTFDQELKTIQERQEKLMNKGGNVEADISFLDGEETEDASDTPTTEEDLTQEDDISQEKAEEELSVDEDMPEEETGDDRQQTEAVDYVEGTITANSALSEYLAIHMLNSREAIDISAFPESADTALVVDAFLEAQYQNPLILGIKEVGMDTYNNVLYIRYDDDAETMEAKRNELEEKVAEIVTEIITDDMSDLEKELAINAYLCDHAEYDDAALENAAENDFQYVDEIYNDSFTAYGVLMKDVGVCASYSAAFKLLADAAGLESVVVTGYLEGNLPHAWNKVMLDGQWNIVDATNNDNEVIQNALFNLSDTAAYSMLVEDDRFVLDSNLYDYEAPFDDKEYYHITDSYYAMDEVADVLADKLQSEGSVMLRTDYDLDDETFNVIAQDTADGARANIAGFHWMGVIYLEQR